MTTDDPPIHVLLVDDHDLFRTGLRALLEEEGLRVDDASNASAAMRKVLADPPDVVVMDLNLPGASGVEATRQVLVAAPRTSVLMLTIDEDDENVLQAVLAGASGYLLKDAELDEVVAGIRAAASGESALASRVAGGLLDRVRTSARDIGNAPSEQPRLTAREREVLQLLAAGCENQEIARQLYVSPSTVRNQVTSILEKLGARNRVQAVMHAIAAGLLEQPRRSR